MNQKIQCTENLIISQIKSIKLLIHKRSIIENKYTDLNAIGASYMQNTKNNDNKNKRNFVEIL